MNSLRSAIPPLARAALHSTAPAAAFARLPALRCSASPFASTSRAFHSAPRASQINSSAFAAKTSSVWRQAAGRFRSESSRSISSSPSSAYGQQSAQVDWTKIGTNVGLAAVAAVGLNFALNRETRGSLLDHERDYLHETFYWTAAGLAITSATAYSLFRSGAAVRLMSANPWLVMGVGLVASLGSMAGVYYTEPDSPLHYVSWAAFTAVQGVTLSPMFFLNPAILGRAGIYTVGALTGLCYVGATAKSDQFLYMGGFLLAGLGVVVASSLAPMLLPRMSMRTMSVMEHVSAYGGVAVFSGFILFDTQKILKHAALAQRGAIKADPIRESVSLILDAINLFVRIVQVMLLQQGGGRRK